jgi:hypothetical protein
MLVACADDLLQLTALEDTCEPLSGLQHREFGERIDDLHVVRRWPGFTMHGRQDQLVDGLAIRGLEVGEDGLDLGGYLSILGQRALADEGSDENARRLTDGRETGDRLQLRTESAAIGFVLERSLSLRQYDSR